jgi:hypothetical protein
MKLERLSKFAVAGLFGVSSVAIAVPVEQTDFSPVVTLLTFSKPLVNIQFLEGILI